MPSATRRADLVVRTRTPSANPPTAKPTHGLSPSCAPLPNSHKGAVAEHHENRYSPYKPPRSPRLMPRGTIAVVNSSGRQAASLIRVASAVGFQVHAQLRNLSGIVAQEISELPNVKVFVGDLYTTNELASPDRQGINHGLIRDLFDGADIAFINTTFWGDEVAIGCALADAAVRANIKHYIYSSMPDHSRHTPPGSPTPWPALPLWSCKMKIEDHIRSLSPALPATFVYTGIYNNNFTSLPYPLFCMELQQDGSFVWQAPFHPDVPLPWLDAEHDVGPAVLQLIKDGPRKWTGPLDPERGCMGDRIAFAYEMLTPTEVCRAFSRGLNRPVRYVHGPIEVKVSIPHGYREQLEALERLYSKEIGGDDGKGQPPYFGSRHLEDSCPGDAMRLWEGHRGIEEYAREVFPLEEVANGRTWMVNESARTSLNGYENGDDEEAEDDDFLTMGESIGRRSDQEWHA